MTIVISAFERSPDGGLELLERQQPAEDLTGPLEAQLESASKQEGSDAVRVALICYGVGLLYALVATLVVLAALVAGSQTRTTRLLGPAHLSLAEDVVQDALVSALVNDALALLHHVENVELADDPRPLDEHGRRPPRRRRGRAGPRRHRVPQHRLGRPGPPPVPAGQRAGSVAAGMTRQPGR